MSAVRDLIRVRRFPPIDGYSVFSAQTEGSFGLAIRFQRLRFITCAMLFASRSGPLVRRRLSTNVASVILPPGYVSASW
jgi:hypothetical protein